MRFYALRSSAAGCSARARGALLRCALRIQSVRYVVTTGMYGRAVAFVAEAAISCGLMMAVLVFSEHPGVASLHRVAGSRASSPSNITFEAPLSGRA